MFCKLFILKYFNFLCPGFIPLCENMPGGKATKPGDVVVAMNGKTIQVICHDILFCHFILGTFSNLEIYID